MGPMEQIRADRLQDAARRLGASETYMRGGRVHVRFSEHGPDRETLGDLHVALSPSRAVIHRYQHTSCARGQQWSRRMAVAVSQLDTVRQLPC